MTKDEAWEMIDSALDHSYSEKDVMEIKEALAQPEQETHNFCPRCGKRLQGVLGRPQMHTCTPPLWGHK